MSMSAHELIHTQDLEKGGPQVLGHCLIRPTVKSVLDSWTGAQTAWAEHFIIGVYLYCNNQGIFQDFS